MKVDGEVKIKTSAVNTLKSVRQSSRYVWVLFPNTIKEVFKVVYKTEWELTKQEPSKCNCMYISQKTLLDFCEDITFLRLKRIMICKIQRPAVQQRYVESDVAWKMSYLVSFCMRIPWNAKTYKVHNRYRLARANTPKSFVVESVNRIGTRLGCTPTLGEFRVFVAAT